MTKNYAAFRQVSIILLVLGFLAPCEARETIRIVGSTAVFPFATLIGERFGIITEFNSPIIEATGTGGGFNLFCAGSGQDYPDIVNASRPISKNERELCAQNDVGEIIEHVLGYDGIVIAVPIDSPFDSIDLEDLYLALAEDVDGTVPNSNKNWRSIKAHLPDTEITVLGPTTTLATREVFEERAIYDQCLKRTQNKAVCSGSIREDGTFHEVAENENAVIQKLELNPNALAFVSYGFYVQNPGRIKALKVNGVLPTPETIADGRYLLSRKLYMYVKKQHLDLIPGLQAYIDGFSHDNAIKMLERKGLIVG